jgi:hypothetical protein
MGRDPRPHGEAPVAIRTDEIGARVQVLFVFARSDSVRERRDGRR